MGVGALILRDDEILLIVRGGEPLRGFWSLPGGGLETGETLEQGVCREVLEETGLHVRPQVVVEIFERIMLDPEGRTEYHYVLIDYLCEALGGTLAAAGDVSRAEWVPKHEVSSLRLTEGTAQVIEKAFRIRDETNQRRAT